MATIPQDVAFELARQTLVSCINSCFNEPLNLKMYEMEILLRDLYAEVSQNAQIEYINNKQTYENTIKAEKQETEVVETL